MDNLGWHFVGCTLRDGELIPDDGVKLVHTGPLVLCESGLHLSRRLIDALNYAPGNTICRVEFGEEFVQDEFKLVARERTILWRINGARVLRDFARSCALDSIHLWDAPALVKKYLETGDEKLRQVVRDAGVRNIHSDARRAAHYSAVSPPYAAARDALIASMLAVAYEKESIEAALALQKLQNARLTSMVLGEHYKQSWDEVFLKNQ